MRKHPASTYSSHRAIPEKEAIEFGDYEFLFAQDDFGNWRPLSSVFDERTGRTSLLVSRAHGKNTFRKLYATAQTNLEIIKCKSDEIICVAGGYISGDGAAGEALIKFAGGDLIFPMFFSKTNSVASEVFHIEGEEGESVLLTTTTGIDKVFVLINYRIIKVI